MPLILNKYENPFTLQWHRDFRIVYRYGSDTRPPLLAVAPKLATDPRRTNRSRLIRLTIGPANVLHAMQHDLRSIAVLKCSLHRDACLMLLDRTTRLAVKIMLRARNCQRWIKLRELGGDLAIPFSTKLHGALFGHHGFEFSVFTATVKIPEILSFALLRENSHVRQCGREKRIACVGVGTGVWVRSRAVRRRGRGLRCRRAALRDPHEGDRAQEGGGAQG